MINKRTFFPKPRKYVQTIAKEVPILYFSLQTTNIALRLERNRSVNKWEGPMTQLKEALL